MPYLIKKTVTVKNVNEDTFVHQEGSVVSDWEVSDFVRGKIKEGSEWYRRHFEPLTEREARAHRVKATDAEGPRVVDGEEVKAPYDDYVGLHPTEIIERMREADLKAVEQVKKFERGGMNRTMITDYIAPSEHAPLENYDALGVRDILEKMAVLSVPAVEDIIAYERNHQDRPAIVEYDRDLYESSDAQPSDQTPAVT